MDAPPEYSPQTLPDAPTATDLAAAAATYRTICLTNIAAIVDRFEAHLAQGRDYPFVDTKFDLTNGRDFPTDDIVRGRDTLYGWIQGRGLEALAGHAAWLEQQPSPHPLAARLRRMAEPIAQSLQRLRQANDGHLFFFMRPDGRPFSLEANGEPRYLTLTTASPSNFSDIFSAKGLLAAAHLLDDKGIQERAETYIQQISTDLWAGRFTSDQQPLDPTDPVQSVPGRIDQGPFMIHLGTCALGAATGNTAAIDQGLDLLDRLLKLHTNINGRQPDLEEGDFWESIDQHQAPYRNDEGRIICDPGHALEFVGLGLKFARAARACPTATAAQLTRLDALIAPLPTILSRNFANGFQPGPGGICKSYDLLDRRTLNTDMPWWSLPETMRAAALCWHIFPDSAIQQQALSIWSACHNAFIEHFVRPEIHLMAIQTRNADGGVSAAIPATADADPGYHTGLSLLDIIDVLPTS
ncbi:MAG: hypothetical protein GKR89_03645 [Candidatus Latescibacteria bacterium]|nr:hypothetical protein [Candidatus Latescibacterota bacterium]